MAICLDFKSKTEYAQNNKYLIIWRNYRGGNRFNQQFSVPALLLQTGWRDCGFEVYISRDRTTINVYGDFNDVRANAKNSPGSITVEGLANNNNITVHSDTATADGVWTRINESVRTNESDLGVSSGEACLTGVSPEKVKIKNKFEWRVTFHVYARVCTSAEYCFNTVKERFIGNGGVTKRTFRTDNFDVGVSQNPTASSQSHY